MGDVITCRNIAHVVIKLIWKYKMIAWCRTLPSVEKKVCTAT